MRSNRLPRVVAALASLLALAGCGAAAAPADVSTGEMFVEISDALNGIRQENAQMQAQLDSLREVVARQDTLIRRIGAATGALPQ
jgi:hypothetical protein